MDAQVIRGHNPSHAQPWIDSRNPLCDGTRKATLNMASNARASVAPQRTTSSELYWLVDVEESRQPVDELCPIWVRP